MLPLFKSLKSLFDLLKHTILLNLRKNVLFSTRNVEFEFHLITVPMCLAYGTVLLILHLFKDRILVALYYVFVVLRAFSLWKAKKRSKMASWLYNARYLPVKASSTILKR